MRRLRKRMASVRDESGFTLVESLMAMIVGLMVVAFIWFEFIEKMLGLDKRKAHDLNEKRRKERVKESFDKRK